MMISVYQNCTCMSTVCQDCRPDSLFCFSFGGSSETIDTFDSMYSAAKRAGGDSIKLYSHDWIPGTAGKLMPQKKSTVDIVLMLSDASDIHWTPARMGDYFTTHHVADPTAAMLRPAWRATLGGGIS